MRGLLIRFKRFLTLPFVKIRQHALLIPTVVAYLSFIVAVLLVISIWFTRGVTVTLENSLYENTSFSTNKAADMLESTFKDILDTAVHINEINELSPRAYRDNTYRAYKTIQLLNSYKYSNLIICYSNSPYLLTLYGTCFAQVFFSETDRPLDLLKTLRNASSIGIASTVDFGASWEDNRLLLHYPLSSLHTAVFVLDSANIAGIISNAIGSVDGLQVLYRSDGSVLWASRAIDSILHEHLSMNITNSNSERKITYNDMDYILSTHDIDYGLKLIVMEKITTQFDNLNTISFMLVLICIIIFFLGIVFLLYNVNKSYIPIANLVREVRTILPGLQDGADSDITTLRQVYSQYSSALQENQINSQLLSEDQLRSMFILRTISGRYTNTEELGILCDRLNISFSHSHFFACQMIFDGTDDLKDRQTIENLLYSTSIDSFNLYSYLLPDNHGAVCIVNVPSDDPTQLDRFGDQLLHCLPELLQTTIGIGQIYPTILDVGKSYLEAHAALDYRLIKGKNTWITYKEISPSESAYAYPHQLVNSYVYAVRTWNVQEIHDMLQKIVDYIYSHNLSLQQVKCICFDLTSAFLREISSLEKHVAPNKASISYDVFSIAEYDSVSELAQKISDFSDNIQHYIVKNDEYQSSSLIVQCKEFMRENISNAQFSLSTCAEHFDIAPQTLRRKFKNDTGLTLSNYLTFLRVEHAKKLLVSSELDVNELCEECGYIDLSSFIRMFKSETGVSPGKYRELYQQKLPGE